MGSGIEAYVSLKMKQRIMAGDIPGWMKGHIRSKYIVKAFLSAPLWMHRSRLRELREECELTSRMTHVRHVLDHIVPIDHPHVCGLTVPWNIQVITYAANASKRNEWHPDQTQFEFSPQLTLCL